MDDNKKAEWIYIKGQFIRKSSINRIRESKSYGTPQVIINEDYCVKNAELKDVMDIITMENSDDSTPYIVGLVRENENLQKKIEELEQSKIFWGEAHRKRYNEAEEENVRLNRILQLTSNEIKEYKQKLSSMEEAMEKGLTLHSGKGILSIFKKDK